MAMLTRNTSAPTGRIQPNRASPRKGRNAVHGESVIFFSGYFDSPAKALPRPGVGHSVAHLKPTSGTMPRRRKIHLAPAPPPPGGNQPVIPHGYTISPMACMNR